MEPKILPVSTGSFQVNKVLVFLDIQEPPQQEAEFEDGVDISDTIVCLQQVFSDDTRSIDVESVDEDQMATTSFLNQTTWNQFFFFAYRINEKGAIYPDAAIYELLSLRLDE